MTTAAVGRRILLPSEAARRLDVPESRLRRLLKRRPDLAVMAGAQRLIDPADLLAVGAALGVPAAPTTEQACTAARGRGCTFAGDPPGSGQGQPRPGFELSDLSPDGP
jgi:hypothetical protein